jgi:hypothetical protein
MKKMQENLQGMVQNVKFKNDDDKALAEKQAQTLEKYFKQQEKSKAEKWASRKLNTTKEETGSALDAEEIAEKAEAIAAEAEGIAAFAVYDDDLRKMAHYFYNLGRQHGVEAAREEAGKAV